jgi:hypothetical protein
MRDLTQTEVDALFSTAHDPRSRVDLLISLVLDLFGEVEALREAMIQASPETRGERVRIGCDIPCRAVERALTPYQRAYLDGAYRLHNSAGPTGGAQKLLARFYPAEAGGDGRAWRERLLLHRLAFSAEEISLYEEAARQAERFT